MSLQTLEDLLCYCSFIASSCHKKQKMSNILLDFRGETSCHKKQKMSNKFSLPRRNPLHGFRWVQQLIYELSVRFAGLCSVNELGLSWRTYRNVLEPILVCSWQRKCLSIHITYFVLSLLILSCRLLTRDETRASPSSSTLANFSPGQLMTSISSSARWSRSEIELLFPFHLYCWDFLVILNLLVHLYPTW